jgi:dTMP kinase
MHKGKLLVLCALDSGGKGTQLKLIQDYLSDLNISFKSYHLPTYQHNYFSEIIAKYLRGELGNIDDVDPLFVATMFAMDRLRFLPDLEKMLKENEVVVLDRYIFSNIAYQGAKFKTLEESKDIRKWIKDFEFEFLKLPYPDLNLFFDVPLDIIKIRLEKERKGEDRAYLNGKQDIHEADIEFQDRVRQNFLEEMYHSRNCKTIKCEKETTPESIFLSYEKHLNKLLFHERI